MNETMLTVSNSEFGKLDILVEDGKELFPANDVARILGYSNPKDAVGRHCRGVVKRDLMDALGRMQKTNFIPEGDLYRLIVRSRLPSAERFEKWLFDEVLPELRRTGRVQIKPVLDMPHIWMGQGSILARDAAKALGVTAHKIRDAMKSKPTVYVAGVDYETLTGDRLGEYKYYNRVRGAAKALTVVLESGYRKLQWELGGVGSPEDTMHLAPPVLSLPAAVAEKNDRMGKCIAQIAQAIQGLNG